MIGANSLSKSQPEASGTKQKTIVSGGSSDASDTASLGSNLWQESDSASESLQEIPFLAVLPNEDEDVVTIESSLVKPVKIFSESTASFRQSIQKHIPKHVVHYAAKLPKYVKIGLSGLVMTFAAHMICIAIGMYQISKIDPRTISIKRLHLRGLDGREAVLEAEAFIPMPWMARFFHINVVKPRVEVFAEGKPILTADIPDLIVGKKGAKVSMNGVKFRMASFPTVSSPLSILLQQFLPKGMLKGRSVNKLKVLATGRLQTKSFWYPLDISVNMEHLIDMAEMKKLLLEKKKKGEKETAQLPEITSVRVSDSGLGSLSTKVTATIKLPPQALAYFMTLDVPELVGRLSLVAPGRPEREAEHLYIGLGRIVPNSLCGRLLNLQDEFQLEASLDNKAEKALRLIFASLRDQQFNLLLRFQVDAKPDSFISQVMALDLWVNVQELIELSKVVDPQQRLVKRGFSDFRSESLFQEKTKKKLTEQMLLSVKKRVEEYAKLNPHYPVATVHLQSLKAEADSACMRISIVLRRSVLSYVSGLDVGRFEGRLPKMAVSLYTELDDDGRLRSKRLGKLTVNMKECRTGSKDLRLDLTVSLRTDVFGDLVFQPGARTILLKRSGSNLAALIMEAFEACLQLTPGRHPEAFLTKKRSSHDHWSGQTFAKIMKIFSVDYYDIRRRKHSVRMAVDADADSLSASLGVALAPKPALETAWPFARIEWSSFRFVLRPTFSRRRLNRLYRSTTLAEAELVAGGLNVSLRPARNPLTLLHAGAVQLTVHVDREGKRWPRAGILDVLRLLLQEYRRDSVRSLAILHRPSVKHKRHLEPLLRVAYENALAHAKGSMQGGGTFREARRFLRLDERLQVEVAGLNNAKINFLVPVPRTERLVLPKAMREDRIRVTIALPPIRILLCDAPSKQQYCPASAGVDRLLVNFGLAHGHRIAVQAHHGNSKLRDHLLAFIQLHSFTDLYGFAEGMLSAGHQQPKLVTGSTDKRLPWSRISLMDRLVNTLGSMLEVPIHTKGMGLLKALKRTASSSSDSHIRYHRREHLQLRAAIESPDPRHLSGRFSMRLPQSLMGDVYEAGPFESDEDSAASQLFLLRWGDLRVKLIAEGLGSGELFLRHGRFGLHLHRLIKGITKGLQRLVSTQTRDLEILLGLELFPTATAFRPQLLRDALSAVLYHLDMDVGALFPRLAQCTRYRDCRRMMRSSKLITEGIEKLLNAEVTMEVEHESISSLLGGHKMSRVLQVRRGLGMLRKLWARYAHRLIERFKSLSANTASVPSDIEASVRLLKHPQQRGSFADVPALLPGFSGDPSRLGIVSQRPLALAVLTVEGVLDRTSAMLASAFRSIYRALDLPSHAPLMLDLRLKAPIVHLNAGVNRMDAVEIISEPISMLHPINVATGMIQSRDESRLQLKAKVQFPREMAEVCGLFAPFGLTPFGQISVAPLPRVRKPGHPTLALLPYNAPMCAGADGSRVPSGANLLSQLISALPDIPIFPVTDRVRPFDFGIQLQRIRPNSLHLHLTGLRFFNPLPNVYLDLGGSLDVLATFQGLPFAKLQFGATRLAPGSNPLAADIEFSPSAFGYPVAEGSAEAGRVKDALDEMISLGAAGKAIDLALLLAIDGDLVLRVPLRIPPRPLTAIAERLLETAPTPTQDVHEEILRAVTQLGSDVGADVLSRIQRSWQEFVGPWLPAAANNSASDNRSTGLFDLRFPLELPWETSVLGVDLAVHLDKPSELCPSIIPSLVTEASTWTLNRSPASSADLQTCPALVMVAPGQRASLMHGLISYDDMPQARFTAQLASNWYKRSAICARVNIKRVVLRLADPSSFDEPFVLDTRITGLPRLAKTWDPALRPCVPEDDVCVPALTERLRELLPHRFLPENWTTLSSGTGSIIIAERFSLHSTYQVSFVLRPSQHLESIGFQIGANDAGLTLLVFPRTGRAELSSIGHPDPIKIVSAGAYPLVPPPGNMQMKMVVMPFEARLSITFSATGSEGTFASFEWADLSLADHLPIGIIPRDLPLSIMAVNSVGQAISEFAVHPFEPSPAHSALFHLRARSPRVLERTRVYLGLRDNCGNRIGRLSTALSIRLMRASDIWDTTPWPPKPSLHQYDLLKQAPSFRLEQMEKEWDDAPPVRDLWFEEIGGVYAFEFMATAPGRYRVFIDYSDGDSWHLLQNHHIFVRQ